MRRSRPRLCSQRRSLSKTLSPKELQMRKRTFFMLVIPAATLLTIAQTFPPGMGNVKQGPRVDGQSRTAEGIMCEFYVQGREYGGVLPATQVKSASTWNSSSPLPFSLARAEKKARGELAKFVSD